MAKKKNNGKLFEEEMQTSCSEQRIWYFRVRDVNPMALKPGFKVPENPYDALMYKDGYLFPSEMKSTKGKSLPFKNIKDHQIESLINANTYDKKIIPGLWINFRDVGRSFFLHIDNYAEYKKAADNSEKELKGRKVNGGSISLDYCEGFAAELLGHKKVKKYRWYVSDLINKLIKKHD